MGTKTILGNREHTKANFRFGGGGGDRGTNQFISGEQGNRYPPGKSSQKARCVRIRCIHNSILHYFRTKRRRRFLYEHRSFRHYHNCAHQWPGSLGSVRWCDDKESLGQGLPTQATRNWRRILTRAAT